MARRVYLGAKGANTVLRVSRQGYDAGNAPLDGLLFDADHVPAQVLGSGNFEAAFNPLQQTQPQVPEITTVAHGKDPDLILAIAKPTNGRSGVGIWAFWGNNPSGGVGSGIVSRALGNAHMDNNYCSPFKFDGDYGSGVTYWGGWGFSWNGNHIVVWNNLANALNVRWVALGF